jgi:hypothetical protein
MVGMKTQQEGATRRNVVMAGSVQALLAFRASAAFAQKPPAAPQQKDDTQEILNRIVARTNFVHAVDLSAVFQYLWGEKIELTLAKVAEGAEATLTEIVTKAQDALVKEYGPNPIDSDRVHVILAGTIYVQNIIFARSSDMKTGVITITAEAIQSMKEYYCAHYPYCK